MLGKVEERLGLPSYRWPRGSSSGLAGGNSATAGWFSATTRATPNIGVKGQIVFVVMRDIEQATGTRFYFVTPHHAWERGTNENTNGLIRQYLPKGQSMARLKQHDCNAIARQLNRRPRKQLGYRTPEECYAG